MGWISAPGWADGSRLYGLRELDLSGNQLSGVIPRELGGLDRLEVLNLGGNQLSGEIPSTLGNPESVAAQPSGETPAALGSFRPTEEQRLEVTPLSSVVVPDTPTIARLAVLDLSDNQLSGPIPLSLSGLVELEELRLQGNQLSGPIPTQLGRFSKLTALWLSDNQLSGAIPGELGRLANLEELFLGGSNQLTGCIPASLRDVAMNDLAGLGLPFCGTS